MHPRREYGKIERLKKDFEEVRQNKQPDEEIDIHDFLTQSRDSAELAYHESQKTLLEEVNLMQKVGLVE